MRGDGGTLLRPDPFAPLVRQLADEPRDPRTHDHDDADDRGRGRERRVREEARSPTGHEEQRHARPDQQHARDRPDRRTVAAGEDRGEPRPSNVGRVGVG